MDVHNPNGRSPKTQAHGLLPSASNNNEIANPVFGRHRNRPKPFPLKEEYRATKQLDMRCVQLEAF